MNSTFFTTNPGIPEEWQLYLANEALAISRLDDFEIDNYADREILNPDMHSFLNEWTDSGINLLSAEFSPLSLSFAASRAKATALFGEKFKRLKGKIREVICKILSDLAGDGDLNWKDIIKLVLIALIPALGGGPLSVIVLPILISLIAKIIKRGLEAVCPVPV